MVAAAVAVWLAPGSVSGQPLLQGVDRTLSFTVNRSSLPAWVTYRDVTYQVVVGDVDDVSVVGDGEPVAAVYDPQNKRVMFSTPATNIQLALTNSTWDAAQLGAVRVTPLRDDKRWAFSLTFDDGYDSVYTLARAYLGRYGYTGGVPLIGRYLDNNHMGAYTYLTDAQVRELYTSGWGIFNHSYGHLYVSNFATTQAALNDVLAAQNRISQGVAPVDAGFRPSVFTAPFVDMAYFPIVRDNAALLGLRLFQGSGSEIRQVDTLSYGADGFLTMGRNGIRHIDPDIDTVHGLVASYPNNHYWLSLHTHTVDAGCDPVETSADYLYATYGAGGTDEVWVAPADRIHQYLLTRDYSVVPSKASISAAAPALQAHAVLVPATVLGQALQQSATVASFQQGVNGYSGVQDTYIEALNPTGAYAGANKLTLSTRGYEQNRSLLRFDVQSIPANAQIVKATLGLYVTGEGSGTICFGGYNLKRSWVAGQSTWTQASGTTTWGEPGANDTTTDRSDTYLPGFRLPLQVANVWEKMDVTFLAKQWVANAASNNGVLLLASAPLGTQYALASSEYSDPALRPVLTISYTLPYGTPTPTKTPSRTPTVTPTRSGPTFTATATPAIPSATTTPTATPTGRPSATPTPQAYDVRVNAGGAAVTDYYGRQWFGDQSYDSFNGWGYLLTPGQPTSAYETTSPITGTPDQSLFRSERFWETRNTVYINGYQFNVPNGPYRVELGFAEIYYNQPGQRCL